jgi:hypothetical protein
MLDKIISVKEAVYDLLTRYPRLRDNDRLLILNVWANQNPSISNAGYLFSDFVEGYKKGIYADTESIRRVRAKIQEQHPELRGEHYGMKKVLDEITRDGITKMKTP